MVCFGAVSWESWLCFCSENYKYSSSLNFVKMLRSGLVKWISAAPIKERCLQYIPMSLLLKVFFLIWGVPALKTVKEEPPLWKREASGVCVMARRALCGSAVFTKEIIMWKHMLRITWLRHLIYYLSIVTKVWTQHVTERPFKTIMQFKWGDIKGSRSVTLLVVYLWPKAFSPFCVL